MAIIRGDQKRICNMYFRGFTKFQITVAYDIKFHWYLGTLSSKFLKARPKIVVFLSISAKLRQPTGQRQENFNFACSLLKF